MASGLESGSSDFKFTALRNITEDSSGNRGLDLGGYHKPQNQSMMSKSAKEGKSVNCFVKSEDNCLRICCVDTENSHKLQYLRNEGNTAEQHLLPSDGTPGTEGFSPLHGSRVNPKG